MPHLPGTTRLPHPLQDLTTDGITIACTIHSPPPFTFELFDSILVLQKGRLVYWGPNGGWKVRQQAGLHASNSAAAGAGLASQRGGPDLGQ